MRVEVAVVGLARELGVDLHTRSEGHPADERGCHCEGNQPVMDMNV
jgi:hypothetical protein